MAAPSYSGLTVATNTTIAKTWGDMVRDSVVNIFANESARASAIPTSTEGMVCYLQNRDALYMCTTGGTPGTWQRESPKGRVGGNRYNAGGGTVIAAGVTTTELVIAMSSGTVSLEAGRSFEIRARVQLVTSAAGSIVTMRFRETGISGTVRAVGYETLAAANFFQTREFVGLYETGASDESKVFVLTAQTNSGTVNFNSGDSSLAVFVDVVDVGPAGSITVV